MDSQPVTTMQRWLFMGNPGAGKSTLLNCLLQRPAFDAGLSFGGGRTQTTQTEPWGDAVVLVDTPGIADIEVRETACAEVTKALEVGGVFKLFFVVTMRNGRAPPEDVATYNEVLRSIQVPNVKFSLIVNNVDMQQYAHVGGSRPSEARDRAIAGLGGGDFSTDSILFVPSLPELDEEDNAVVTLPNFVLKFLDAAPTCEIPPKSVVKINTDADFFRAQAAAMASDVRAVLEEREVLQQYLASLEQPSPSDPRAVVPSGVAQQAAYPTQPTSTRLAFNRADAPPHDADRRTPHSTPSGPQANTERSSIHPHHALPRSNSGTYAPSSRVVAGQTEQSGLDDRVDNDGPHTPTKRSSLLSRLGSKSWQRK